MEQANQNLIAIAEAELHEKENREKAIQEDYKKVFEDIGKAGKYQKIVMLIFLIAAFVGYYLITLVPLMKELPDYHCFNLEDFNDEPEFEKYKSDPAHYQIIKDEHCIQRSCKTRIPNEPLPWILVVDLKSNTNFVTDYGVFCRIDDFFGSITQVLFIGRLIGMFVFSYIGDQYGRKWSYNGQLYITIVSLVLLGLFKSEGKLLFFTFLNGFSSQIFVITIVICSEIMDQTMFSFYNGVINAFFPFCGIFNVLLVYLTKNWNITLIIVIALVCLAAVFGAKYVLESPSFLISHKRYDVVNQAITLIAGLNGKGDIAEEQIRQITSKYRLPLTPRGNHIDFEYKQKVFERQQKKRSSLKEMTKIQIKVETKEPSKLKQILGPYYTIFSDPFSAFKMLLCCIMFFNLFFIYFGLLYNLDKLEGNIYVHTAIVYTSEFIAETLCGVILAKYRRIRILFVTNLICLGCCVVLLESEGLFAEIALFTNSFFISIAFVAMICYTTELFEPAVRSTATSIGLNSGVLSLILMPYLLKISGSPFPVFIVMLLINMMLMMKMKETKLDDSVSEAFHH